MVQHRTEFDHELGDIEAKVIELFNMVAEDLPEATAALVLLAAELADLYVERAEPEP